MPWRRGTSPWPAPWAEDEDGDGDDEEPAGAPLPPRNPQEPRKQWYTNSPSSFMVTLRLFSLSVPPRHLGQEVRWVPGP